MFNLLDIVQLKTKKDRDEIEEILTAAIEGTKECLTEGNDVYWVGLCRFSWKQKAKTKKAAKEWTEYPYLAEGEKVRCIPATEMEVSALGVVTRMKRELIDGKTQMVDPQAKRSTATASTTTAS